MDYRTTVTKIGAMVAELLEQNIVIVFNDDAPPELIELAVNHTIARLDRDVGVGDTVILGDGSYVVTAVGDEVNVTMRKMGHCTLSFSGNDVAELPGYLELRGEGIPEVKVGDKFEILFSGI